MKIFKKKNCKCCANKGTASETRAQQKVLCPDDYREGDVESIICSAYPSFSFSGRNSAGQ